MRDKLHIAISLANLFHKGQIDKGGNPYILHPLAVMNSVDTTEEKIVALLHDILEDTNCTEDVLLEYIPKHLFDAVILLTRQEGQTYNNYINNIKDNELARKVKIADIKHNMDLSRIKNRPLTDDDMIKNLRYYKSLVKLGGNINLGDLVFGEDEQKIVDALTYYPLGSSQLGNIAVMSGKLQGMSVDVCDMLNELLDAELGEY